MCSFPGTTPESRGKGINLKLLLQQLKGPVSVVTSLFFHPEQQQQQPMPLDLSCACEGRALDLLGAIRLARCLQLLAKKRNGIKKYLKLIYLWAVNWGWLLMDVFPLRSLPLQFWNGRTELYFSGLLPCHKIKPGQFFKLHQFISSSPDHPA